MRWAAPRGWKVSAPIPTNAPPALLTFAPPGQPDSWLTVEALVSGPSTEQVLARRPQGITHVATEGGWTCGEEPDGGAAVCAAAGELVTLVVELGGAPSRAGGVPALRRAAALMTGFWPRGLPRPDAAGHLPAAEWAEWTAHDGRVTWMMPRGWTRTDGVPRSTDAPPSALSFNASAGTGSLSISAQPGLAAASPSVAEERVIKLLVPDASLTHADGWTCGEGTEASSGLPSITCAKVTPLRSLYVSVRAEPAVLHTLGGVASVRAAATHVKGLGL